MFNIGFGELAIICLVLIIAVGPDRLPAMMKTLGKTLRTVRQASRDIRASTGIDELLREDFDLYAPPPAPRRPAVAPTPAALPAPATNPELGVAQTDPAPPKPLSREESVELADAAETPDVAEAATVTMPAPAESTASSPAAPSTDGTVTATVTMPASQESPAPARADDGTRAAAHTPSGRDEPAASAETEAQKPRED